MAAPRFLSPIDEAKRAMRAHGRAIRRHPNPSEAARALTNHVLSAAPPPEGAIVAGFWPLDGEIDIRPLLAVLHDKGHDIVLPVTPPRGQPLTFRRWRPNEPMVTERFGTQRPTGPEAVPSFLLVPLLAFDRQGGRLGYGGGYYDLTLPGLSPRFTLGCAFASQEVPAVPMEPHDIRLDAIVTEHEVIRPEWR